MQYKGFLCSVSVEVPYLDTTWTISERLPVPPVFASFVRSRVRSRTSRETLHSNPVYCMHSSRATCAPLKRDRDAARLKPTAQSFIRSSSIAVTLEGRAGGACRMTHVPHISYLYESQASVG